MLVICDYATWYPEAVTLRSTDAEQNSSPNCTIRKRTALSSGLTKPSKQCYGRLHRPKAKTETNSFHSCYLRIGRYLSPPWGSPHLNAFMGGLSEDHWTSYASLGKLQRRLMTVLYRTYCLCGISCRKCLSWRVETCMQHRAPRRSGMIGRPERDLSS